MSVHQSKPRRSKTLVLLMLCSVLAFIAVLALPSSVSAAPPFANLIVSGIVYDEAGNPLDGASVVVTDTTTPFSDSFETVEGTYYVSIPGQGGWNVGDTIEVVATYGGDEATNTSVATAEMEISGMEVDVHFGTAIPQLGSSIGMAVAAGLVGVVAVAAVGVRRR